MADHAPSIVMPRLRTVLGAAGYVVDLEPSLEGSVLTGIGSEPRLLRVRNVLTSSQPLLEGTVLQGAVEAKIANRPTVLVVRVRHIPADGGTHLVAMMEAAQVSHVPVILLAEEGRHLVVVGTLAVIDDPADRLKHPAGPRQRPVARADLSFSPAQRWIMRALLQSPLAGCGWWSGPTGPWQTAQDLAQAGGLSLATTTRCVNALMARGWLEKARTGFQVLDAEGLLRTCADHARLHPQVAMPLRVAYGGPGEPTPQAMLAWMREQIGAATGQRDTADASVALTGWQALGAHGMAIISGLDTKPLQIALSGDYRSVMDTCHLVSATPATAQLLLYPDLGALDVPPAPAQAVDPVQAMLCVAADLAHGPEQVAEVIHRLVRALSETTT